MDFQNLLARTSHILKELEIPYIITGGYAVCYWGRPRSTFDIDVVVELPDSKVKQLTEALRQISESIYVDEITVQNAVKEKGEFNIIHADSGTKIDFWLLKEKDPFDISRLRRAIKKEVLGHDVYLSSPEDLILAKLKWNQESPSDRNLEDVKSIFKFSGKDLDMKYLKGWAEKLGVSDDLTELMKK